jgi:peroxin-16
MQPQARQPMPPKGSGIKNTMSMPSQWVNMYDDFITKNAHQVSQIESTLRSLTYIIPGTISPPAPKAQNRANTD